MEWWYIWGDQATKLMEMSDERGYDVPAIKSMPQLTPEATEVANAFKVLTKVRGANGFGGVNPIPLGDIRDYIRMFGAPWIGRQLFVDLIVATDYQFREVIATKRAEPKKVDFKPVITEGKVVAGRRDETDG